MEKLKEIKIERKAKHQRFGNSIGIYLPNEFTTMAQMKAGDLLLIYKTNKSKIKIYPLDALKELDEKYIKFDIITLQKIGNGLAITIPHAFCLDLSITIPLFKNPAKKQAFISIISFKANSNHCSLSPLQL